MTPHDEEFAVVVIGLLFGGALYFIAAHLSGIPVSLHLGHALLAGAGLTTGIHLFYCACNPAHLVHVAAQNASDLPATVHISIGGIHRMEIAAGAIILTFISGKSLFSLWQHPGGAPH